MALAKLSDFSPPRDELNAVFGRVHIITGYGIWHLFLVHLILLAAKCDNDGLPTDGIDESGGGVRRECESGRESRVPIRVSGPLSRASSTA